MKGKYHNYSSPPPYSEFFHITTSINNVAVPGRAAARGHVGHRSRSDRRTPASSATARPTQAPVCAVQARPVQAPGARPAPRRARYKPGLFMSPHTPRISCNITMVNMYTVALLL